MQVSATSRPIYTVSHRYCVRKRRWRWTPYDQLHWYQRHIVPLIGIAILSWMAVTAFFLGSSDPPIFGASDGGQLNDFQLSIVGHLLPFGLLGFLAALGALMLSRSERLLVALIVALPVGGLWALSTEWLQTRVSARNGNLEDLLVDILGTFIGGLMAWAFYVWYRSAKRHRRLSSLLRS